METFNILDKAISFDDSLRIYAEIHSKSVSYCNTFLNKFNIETSQPIRNMADFLDNIKQLNRFMNSEFSIIADEVINVIVEYGVFDKSSNDIVAHCKTISEYKEYMNYYMDEIGKCLATYEKDRNEISYQAKRTANKIYEPYYLGVISTSSWDIVTTGIINDIEEYKMEKKQDRFVKSQLRKVDELIKKSSTELALDNYETFHKTIYALGIDTITEMFSYGIEILILENIIPYTITDNIQREKAENILNNISRIQDENIIKEQLLVALQANPFSTKAHLKIIDYISNDLNEYIKLLKFIKGEDIIFSICLQKRLENANNQKYVDILKQIDEKGDYYQKYLNSSAHYSNRINNVATSINDNTLSKTNNYLKNLTTQSYKLEFNSVYDLFFVSACSIGQIQTQDRANGHIVVITPMKTMGTQLFGSAGLLSSVGVDIRISKINEIETSVTIGTYAGIDNTSASKMMKMIFNTDPNNFSGPRWIQMLLDEVNKRLNPSNNTDNQPQKRVKKSSSKIGRIFKLSSIITFSIVFFISLLASFTQGIENFFECILVDSIILYPMILLIVSIYIAFAS